MKVKSIIAMTAFVFAGPALAQNKPVLENMPASNKKKVAITESKYALDVQASSAKWEGHKVASSHQGTVAFKEGEFVAKKGNKLTGKVVVDLNTITNQDLTDKDYNAKLVGHLKSEDFFDVAKHPTAEFKITQLNEVHNFVEGQPNAIVTGVFTIRGKTSKPKKLMMFYTPNENGFEVTGKIQIDRTEHGLKYNSKKFFSIEKLGDKLIKDTFDVDLKIVAKKV